MSSKKGALAVVWLLATCDPGSEPASVTEAESSHIALGTIPSSEAAAWKRVGWGNTPDGRYLQAAAFDEDRQTVVVFGGATSTSQKGTATLNQETWEWSVLTGKWTNRTADGPKPDARLGAALVYDSDRKKMVLFGGRAGSGFNLEDTWEWDPATGAWTNLTSAGGHPAARSQHGMVYEKSAKKVLLFGGGRSDTSAYDGTGISLALGDTWEWDPATNTWASDTTGVAPSPRHDLGMVWDSLRNRVVLFGGMEKDIAGAGGVPKQDTWEWDPEARAWTERTAAGDKPSQRYGHAAAFDARNGRMVVFGGSDVSTGGIVNDVWMWEPVTGQWKQPLSGSEPGLPTPRVYASMVWGGASLEVVCGAIMSSNGGMGGRVPPPIPGYGTFGTSEVWELDPVGWAFANRTPAPDLPSPRSFHAMATDPGSGKVYVFGGTGALGEQLSDLWVWDGKAWTQIVTDQGPSARTAAAMAYDPARSTMLLFGGASSGKSGQLDDTWEFSPSAKKWTQLQPAAKADALSGHAMVSDTARKRVILFGGMGSYGRDPGGADPLRKDIWEWDGAQLTWTKRTPAASTASPSFRSSPMFAYDPGRQKALLYDGPGSSIASPTAFWEWDPITAGWAIRDPKDTVSYSYANVLAFDSLRERAVILTELWSDSAGSGETWEIDTRAPTFYVRTIPGSPPPRSGASMAFDVQRGVMVMFGGQLRTGSVSNETWEYQVTGWGNGTACSAGFPSSCASGYCVDGVCCEVAACSGACKSCSVPGAEGTCVLAKAGTEVPGSCSNGQACDGSGNCKYVNGKGCSSGDICASGFCADGVCCDSACTSACSSCNQPGRAGKCSPYLAGTDPESECGQGTDVCKSTCDGVGSCAYPRENVVCGHCLGCDGAGTCSFVDKYCMYAGGAGGSVVPVRGGAPGKGGTSGMAGATGMAGAIGSGGTGATTTARGGSGGTGGTTTAAGGTGATTARGGSGGTGGTNTGRGGSGGAAGTRGGAGGAGGSGGSVAAGGAMATGGRMGSGGSTGSGPGSGGTGGRRDAGGAIGLPDAAPTLVTAARLHRSGCECDVRGVPRAGGWLVSLGVAAFTLLVRRRRRS